MNKLETFEDALSKREKFQHTKLKRKCLFVQSVCTNYGLFVQSICTNKGLIVKSLIYFFFFMQAVAAAAVKQLWVSVQIKA